MKVLLLGEFSSLHKFLKEGLIENGCNEVILAANGDGWKQIGGADTVLYEIKHSNKIGKRLDYYLSPKDKIKQLYGYDVVQFINHKLFPPLINSHLNRDIVKHNNFVSLAAAGDDYALTQAYYDGKFETYIYDYDKQVLLDVYNEKTLKGKANIKSAKELSQAANIIIPSTYEYSIGYEGTSNLGPIIPFPINVSNIKYIRNSVDDKVVFFHGINREAAKGTAIIREAMERIKKDYHNEVEIIIDGHMPYKEYIEVLSRTNVVIDQCLSYGYGINTCISLAQGKVVMAPCKKETMKAYGIDETPIIHIEPSVEDIYEKMVWIIQNKQNIPELGYFGREYVCKMHDYRRIAEMYLKAWNY